MLILSPCLSTELVVVLSQGTRIYFAGKSPGGNILRPERARIAVSELSRFPHA